MLRQYLVKFSRAIKLSPKKSAKIYIGWANVSEELNDYPNRLIKLKRALAINPRQHKYIQCVVDCLKHLNKHEEALMYTKKKLELDPCRIPFHKDLLQALQAQSEDFESHYEAFLSLHPENRTNSEFYFAKARAFIELNEYPSALESYKKTVELYPDNYEFHFNYGLALYHEECFEEALSEFEQLLELTPQIEMHIIILLLLLIAWETSLKQLRNWSIL